MSLWKATKAIRTDEYTANREAVFQVVAKEESSMLHSDDLDRNPLRNLGTSLKGKIAARSLVEYARTNDHKHCVFVGRDYRSCMGAFLQAQKAIPDAELHSFSQSRLHLALNNGSIISFVSAQSPETLKGRQMHYISMSPLVSLSDPVYTEVIREIVVHSESCIVTQENSL